MTSKESANAGGGVVRVGFGPITTSNSFHQSGRKVAGVLERDPSFSCGFLTWNPFVLEELLAYDVLVFIKYFPPYEVLQELKKRGKKLILDYQDMFLYPSVYEQNALKKILKQVYYFRLERDSRRQLGLFDLCFVASPVLPDIVEEAGIRPFFLQRQLYNDRNETLFRDHSRQQERLTIYWTGVSLNQVQNAPIMPVLKMLKERYGCRIVYSSDAIGSESFIEYRLWRREGWEEELAEVDIAFRWRDTSNLQRCKDANKVMAYMGAALPVVMYPTESEKALVQDGVTGIFAYSVDDFEKAMVALVSDSALRKRVGMAAHREVWSRYSLKHHVAEIKRAIGEVSGFHP